MKFLLIYILLFVLLFVLIFTGFCIHGKNQVSIHYVTLGPWEYHQFYLWQDLPQALSSKYKRIYFIFAYSLVTKKKFHSGWSPFGGVFYLY